MTRGGNFALTIRKHWPPLRRIPAQRFFPTSLLSAAVNKKILLLRNDARERRALSLLLVDAGFFVASFTNPQEALAVAKREEFDLVVSDYQGGEDLGFGFVKAIKDSQPWMPVMVISNELEMDQVIEALRLKVKDLFIPPFETSEFLDAVIKILCPEEEVEKPKYSDQDMYDVSSLLMGSFSLDENGNGRPPINKGGTTTQVSPPDRMKGPKVDNESESAGSDDSHLAKVVEDLKRQIEDKEKTLSSEEAKWLETKNALKDRVLKLEENSAILQEKLEEESEKRMAEVAEERASIIGREKELEAKRESLEKQLAEIKANGSVSESALLDEAETLKAELKDKESKLADRENELEKAKAEHEAFIEKEMQAQKERQNAVELELKESLSQIEAVQQEASSLQATKEEVFAKSELIEAKELELNQLSEDIQHQTEECERTKDLIETEKKQLEDMRQRQLSYLEEVESLAEEKDEFSEERLKFRREVADSHSRQEEQRQKLLKERNEIDAQRKEVEQLVNMAGQAKDDVEKFEAIKRAVEMDREQLERERKILQDDQGHFEEERQLLLEEKTRLKKERKQLLDDTWKLFGKQQGSE